MHPSHKEKFFRAKLFFCLFISLALLTSCKDLSGIESEVITYPAPEDEMLSEDFILEVNGQPVRIQVDRSNGG